MLVAMPELPEVESVRRHLEPALAGVRIEEVELRHPRTGRRNLRPSDVPERLTGRRVVSLGRTGKFLFLPLDAGLTWVLHLGMSGRIQLATIGEAERPHTHFVARTERGAEVRLVDPRTFGFVAVLTDDEVEGSSFAALGPDALTALPGPERFAALFAGRVAPVKALLLDQRLIAGLGNIYADEVLHRAGVDPRRPGGSLDAVRAGTIRSAVRPVLRAGIRHGGTSLDDLAYLLPDGRAGDYLRRLRVYGREGDPCRRCGCPIRRTVVAQRSTYFCEGCQS
jgi:formamidopyrimidine-DNA glycosylase